MKRITGILIVSLTLLTSCMYSNYPQNANKIYPHTIPEEVLIFKKDIDMKYEVIGLVGVEKNGNGNTALECLKKKAAKQGADAIIHVKTIIINSASPRISISGVTVKLTENTDEIIQCII